jgi:MoCo/4Fe-4S cofactor protein with predicted Tat translocation signal
MTASRDAPFWTELRERVARESGPQLWRSLEELADRPEVRRFMKAEFPDLARPDLVDRRRLLRLMAASLALAGVAACGSSPPPLYSRPRGVPGHLRGLSLVFATTLDLGGYGHGVLVDTHDGRPIRIDGNPLHPASLGALDVFGQAEILSLYDPDRSFAPREAAVERSWAACNGFLASLKAELASSRGKGLRILAEPLASPTSRRLMDALRSTYPGAVWHEYSPILDDNRRLGAIMAFGRPADTVLDLTRADVVVSLGGDPFLEAPGHIRYAADFATRKRAGIESGARPRLTVAETTPSITGASAHDRIVLRPSEFEPFARTMLASLRAEPVPGDGAVHPAAAAVAADLAAAGPRGLMIVGREQAPIIHALAHAINAQLGAPGQTLRYIAPVAPTPKGQVESLVELAEAVARSSVSHLLILGGNPAYDAPVDLNFAELIRRVPVSLHLSTHFDETSIACRWHVPGRHALESWGDIRAFDGTVGLSQPATTPLIEALTLDELLARLVLETSPDGRELVRDYWRTQWADGFGAAGFEDLWLRALETGVVPDTAFQPLDLTLRDDWDPGPANASARGGIAVTFTADPSMWDGRFANNGWLQELPKPLTKIVWGNAALMAPATAEALGFEAGDIGEIRVGDLVLRVPIWPMPGQAPETLSLQLGYGRWAAGRVGDRIGFNAYRLRLSEQPWRLDGARITKAGERHEIVSTQHQHWIEGRDIVRVMTPGDLAAPGAKDEEQPSAYPESSYPAYAWSMAVDLDACIGCNACVIACQSENNIPVIGPEEAARGRIMHWLRVDRYYAGEPDNPKAYFQPVPCMHCEKAPCEVVCPVNATVHSSEGLNDMVYNRCIGTRTCSNNCPYKVRRFNWFDYSGGEPNTMPAQANPQVTIRPRGVMEKCTYCVQRISAARITARLEDRAIEDGEIKTACQQACPTRAIVFGDANDPTTLVSRLKAGPRNYALLGGLNTRPRTTYLARVEEEARPMSGRAKKG